MAGYALSFAGNLGTSYVINKTNKIIATFTNASISLWFKTRTTGNPSGNGYALYAERAASGNDIWKVDMFGSGGDIGKVGLTHRDDAGTLTQLKSVATYNDTNIHHLVITKSGTSIVIYVDKVLASGTLSGNDTLTNAGLEAWSGGDKGDNLANFDGTIDDIRLYNATLTANDVANLYDGVGVNHDLIDLWNFDDNGGLTAKDIGGGANHGTLSGANVPTWVSGIATFSSSLNMKPKNNLRPRPFAPGLAR